MAELHENAALSFCKLAPFWSLTNGRGSWIVGTSRGSWVVGVGVGVGVSNITNEELIMIINMNIINISYV